jgi:hypothetical protein
LINKPPAAFNQSVPVGAVPRVIARLETSVEAIPLDIGTVLPAGDNRMLFTVVARNVFFEAIPFTTCRALY